MKKGGLRNGAQDVTSQWSCLTCPECKETMSHPITTEEIVIVEIDATTKEQAVRQLAERLLRAKSTSQPVSRGALPSLTLSLTLSPSLR